jgi:pimeloyl-ACP methyl ester carboxylesterase
MFVAQPGIRLVGALPGSTAGCWTTQSTWGEQLKSREEIMEILEAFDLTHHLIERLLARRLLIHWDWSRPSDREANRHLLPTAEFTQVPNAGHFIALERPDVPADLLNSVA